MGSHLRAYPCACYMLHSGSNLSEHVDTHGCMAQLVCKFSNFWMFDFLR